MNAIFPGSFDPWHKGHEEVLNMALKDFDKVYVVIMENPEKPTHRLEIEDRLKKMEYLKSDRVIVDYHKGLATEYFPIANTSVIIRGYRNQEDFEYEMEKERRYKKQNPNVIFKLYKGISDISSTKGAK